MRLSAIAGLVGLLLVPGCTNNPYPDADQGKKVLYSSFNEAPKTLDPAVAYTTAEHVVTGTVYDTLLEYHFLKRPYELIPGLAEAVPKPETQADGRQVYRFKLRQGVLFHADPCFALSQQGRDTREVLAADVAFQLARLADPAVNSPVASTFADVLGFTDFAKRLAERRKADPAFAALPAQEQYKRAGGIEGVVVRGEPRPRHRAGRAQSADPLLVRDAVHHADGVGGGGLLRRQARAAQLRRSRGRHGPFRLAVYEKQHRFVLERNPSWYGTLQARSQARRARSFQPRSTPRTSSARRIDPSYAGRPLPFLDRISFSREREGIPRFNKFLQGYYDDGGIIKESFDAIIKDDRLSPEMAARGMRLDKEVEPTIFYIGFNMDDAVIGTAGR